MSRPMAAEHLTVLVRRLFFLKSREESARGMLRDAGLSDGRRKRALEGYGGIGLPPCPACNKSSRIGPGTTRLE